MTPFTLIMAYYDNPGMLSQHMLAWRALPEDIRDSLHVRIIDDGSPRWPARDVCTWGAQPAGLDIASFELWRMLVDVPWNQDACRNLGVQHSGSEWLLMTDMDHVVPVETWQRLMGGKLDARRTYRFGRVNAPNMEPYKHHPNSWAMTRETFWRSGGYDEALAGYYGTDGDFGRRVLAVAPLVELPEVIIRYSRDVIADASTTTLTRKNPDDKEAIYRLYKQRRPDWKPKTLSFPYERVV